MQSGLNTDERELVLKLKDGDQHAFTKLMETYKRLLAKRILRILKSSEDTEEVLQELFIRMWLHRHKINEDLPLKAYLFHIGENLIYDAIRKAEREKKFLTSYKQTHAGEAYSHIEERLYKAENRELLNSLIDKIPEPSRAVFKLCKLEGRSYEEAGKILSISSATVNSHITKGNKILRDYLKNHTTILALLAAQYIFLN